jgi:glycosyltransferase involved in cell wall biosynthesis
MRLYGRRFFYTHYSFFGGVASWLVSSIFGGHAYYWNAGMPWLYRRGHLEEAVFRFVLRHCTLVTGSAGLAGEYSKRYSLDSRDTRILPNWINLSRFETVTRIHAREVLRITSEAKIVLFVHHLSKRKGAHLLFEIASRVLDEEKRAIFLIVGDGPEKKNLESRVKSQGMSERIRIIGEVPHRDIPLYFASADAFLMPSEEEGFPHVLLEAMAVGVPYVASDVGAVREITPSILAEHIVHSGDVRSFVEQIVSLVRLSESSRGRIKAVEQDWVQRYGITSVCKEFVSLFS